MHGAKINSFLSLPATLKKKTALIFNILNREKYLFNFFLLTVFFVIYALIISQIKSHTKLKENNFNSFLESNEFTNIKEFIFENLNSPYREYNYTVKNNDTLEKILKKYNIESSDINKIAIEIRRKKLSNIYAGTKIKVITKKQKENNKIISLFYPIDGITSVEIKKKKMSLLLLRVF